MSYSKPLNYITDLAIATAGSVDSGKSTFIGVVISGKLDDGNGSARSTVAVHQHEIESGKTSAISTRTFITGDRAITFIDVAGHEKYFKTTAFAFSGRYPDYAFLIISPNRGITPMTKEHLQYLMSLNIPFLVVITHTDMAPELIYKNTRDNITKMLKKGTSSVNFVNDPFGTLKDLYNKSDLSSDEADLITKHKADAVESILNGLMKCPDGKQNEYPVISISNKTGFYLDVVRSVIEKLHTRPFWSPTSDASVNNNKIVKLFKSKIKDPKLLPDYKTFNGTIFYVDSAFNPPGIGLTAAGINRGNPIQVKDKMWLGPFGKEFYEINIKSMHNNIRQLVSTLDDHHRGCIAFRPVKDDLKRDQIRKGIIAVAPFELTNQICYHFTAAIVLVDKSITLKKGYSPVIHMSTIRQSAKITEIFENESDDVVDPNQSTEKKTFKTLKSGEVGVVEFKFKSRPEYVEAYNLFVFKSGEIHGVGMVLQPKTLANDSDAKPDQYKTRKFKRQFKKPGQSKLDQKK